MVGDEQTPDRARHASIPTTSRRQPETYLRSTYRDWRKILDDTGCQPISSTADQVLSTRYANTMGIRRRHKGSMAVLRAT